MFHMKNSQPLLAHFLEHPGPIKGQLKPEVDERRLVFPVRTSVSDGRRGGSNPGLTVWSLRSRLVVVRATMSIAPGFDGPASNNRC